LTALKSAAWVPAFSGSAAAGAGCCGPVRLRAAARLGPGSGPGPARDIMRRGPWALMGFYGSAGVPGRVLIGSLGAGSYGPG
jgi:hypothetical protein